MPPLLAQFSLSDHLVTAAVSTNSSAVYLLRIVALKHANDVLVQRYLVYLDDGDERIARAMIRNGRHKLLHKRNSLKMYLLQCQVHHRLRRPFLR